MPLLGGLGKTLGMTAIAVLLSSCGSQGNPSAGTTQVGQLTVVPAAAPKGAETPGAQWLEIRGAGGHSDSRQLAVVFRPAGKGPFPVVVELHGNPGGLKNVDVEWAAELARAGFITLAGCWFRDVESPGTTAQFYELTLQLYGCPRIDASEPDAIGALIAVAIAQPGARSGELGVYGMSAGGGAAASAIGDRTDVRAAVLDSPAVTPATSTNINSPVLVLSGTGDEYVPFASQAGYIAALKAAGKTVESHVYEGGRHTLILDPTNSADAKARTIAFLHEQLG